MAVLDARTQEIITNMTPGSVQVGLGVLMEQALSGALPPGSVALNEIEMAVAGKVITSNGVAVADSWKTPGFSGTGATISPTAALDAAPTFSGTPDTISPTAALDAAPTFSGTPDTITATGTNSATQLDLGTPAFSGTGLTAAGQDITTTDNQTMTLNECAGMWLIPATGATPAVMILSNTAVAGAPAVLTVQGVAMTDAGAYKIVKNRAAAFTGSGVAYTPAGTNSTPTITVTGAAYTPAGTNNAPTITVTGAAYTPAGSVTLS